MFKRPQERGGKLSDFNWYFKRILEKNVPHSGCGFGIGRILEFIKGKEDIREVITFPLNQENII